MEALLHSWFFNYPLLHFKNRCRSVIQHFYNVTICKGTSLSQLTTVKDVTMSLVTKAFQKMDPTGPYEPRLQLFWFHIDTG